MKWIVSARSLRLPGLAAAAICGCLACGSTDAPADNPGGPSGADAGGDAGPGGAGNGDAGGGDGGRSDGGASATRQYPSIEGNQRFYAGGDQISFTAAGGPDLPATLGRSPSTRPPGPEPSRARCSRTSRRTTRPSR